MSKTLTDECWRSLGEGYQNVAEAQGIEVTYQAVQSEGDQLAITKNLITQGLDALLLSPQTDANLQPALETAEAAGIPMLNVNDAVLPSAEHHVGNVQGTTVRASRSSSSTTAPAVEINIMDALFVAVASRDLATVEANLARTRRASKPSASGRGRGWARKRASSWWEASTTTSWSGPPTNPPRARRWPAIAGRRSSAARAATKRWRPRAGVPTRMLGAVGDDAFGAFLRDHLRRGGVDDAQMATLHGRASGMSIAISDATGDYGAVIVSGANGEIDLAALGADALWRDATMLVLQNEVSDNLNLAAAKAARARGLQVCLNAAPYRPLPSPLAALVNVLVVNALEAEALSGVPIRAIAGAEEAARTLARRFPVAVVTAGGDGVAVAGQGGPHFARPAEPITPVSTHGAGDVFTGVLAAGLTKGFSLEDAVAEANRRAARHVAGLS